MIMEKIIRKTLIYKSNVEYADYCLNHVEGCAHGCTYPCYAMMLKKRCGIVKSYEEWTKPKIVGNCLELIEKEIPKFKNKIHKLFLCFSTDPFMYKVNEVESLTINILRILYKQNISSVLISKGLYPESLIYDPLISKENEYGISVVSLSDDFRKKYEPNASPIDYRIKALKRFHDAGLKTWVSMEPYPTPNIIDQDIYELLSEISFVDRIVFGKWNYNSKSTGYSDYKNFYSTKIKEVIKFGYDNEIEVYIKNDTLNLSDSN